MRDIVVHALVVLAAAGLVLPLHGYGRQNPHVAATEDALSAPVSDQGGSGLCDDIRGEGKAVGRGKKCATLGGSRGIARGDFNGDGFGDLAIGVPNEDVNVGAALPISDGGAVNVIYGSADGLTKGGAALGVTGNQFWTQGNTIGTAEVEPGDLFGSALASGDFNGDAVSDLAIGIPGEDGSRGAVQVLFGSLPTATSLGGLTKTGTRLFRAAAFGLGVARFGNALAWGKFDVDTRGDLVIGATSTVVVLHGTDTGPGTTGFQRQDIPGTLVLAVGDFTADGISDLAVGTPDESPVDPVTGNLVERAGVVRIFFGSPSGVDFSAAQVITQFNLAASDHPQKDDHFGAALAAGSFNCDAAADLAIGVPDEDLSDAVGNTLADAGAVDVVYAVPSGGGLDATSHQFWHQALGTAGIPGKLEAGDRFGAALAVGNFNGRETAGGVLGVNCADLAVGVPLEDFDESTPVVLDSGAVNVIYGSLPGLKASGSQFIHENLSGIVGVASAHDEFGSALTAWDFNGDGASDLAVGVPLEDLVLGDGTVLVNAGQVQVMNGRASTTTCCPIRVVAGSLLLKSHAFNQNSSGILDIAEAGDRFGSAVY